MKNTQIYSKIELLNRRRKQARAISKDQKRKNNKYEMIFKAFLNSQKINHVYQKPFYTHEWFYCADFFIPSSKLIIEIDGSSHKKGADEKRSMRLITLKNVERIIRVKNSELIKSPEEAYKRVLNEIIPTKKVDNSIKAILRRINELHSIVGFTPELLQEISRQSKEYINKRGEV